MRASYIIWRREMLACFSSPVAYVTLVAYLAASGFTFWLACFRNEGVPDPLAVLLCGSLLLWLPILVTVVAMRLFVEEKRAGTIETLLTAPVTEGEVVWGKYAGALTFLWVALAPAATYPFVIERLSPVLTTANMDLGALAGGVLILALVTAAFLAIALVVSLTTLNQIVAAIGSFVTLCLIMMGGWLLGESAHVPEALAAALDVTRHVDAFARGMVEARALTLYVTVTALMLFVAARMLESRRWK